MRVLYEFCAFIFIIVDWDLAVGSYDGAAPAAGSLYVMWRGAWCI